eukprot:g5322.t1
MSRSPFDRKSSFSQQLKLKLVPHASTFQPVIDYAWERRLLRLERRHMSMQSRQALVSTLGGANFQVGRLRTARKLALEQLSIAEQLGDERMCGRCRIYLAYSDIEACNFFAAFQRLQEELFISKCRGDFLVLRLVNIAFYHLSQRVLLMKESKKCLFESNVIK